MLLLTDSISKEDGCWELRLRCGELGARLLRGFLGVGLRAPSWPQTGWDGGCPRQPCWSRGSVLGDRGSACPSYPQLSASSSWR